MRTTAGELRRPFSDAYHLFVKVADELGFPHMFEFDDALLVAQQIADERAAGKPDGAEDTRAPLGRLPYIILSYLDTEPPDELMADWNARIQRLMGYVKDGSIDRTFGAVGDRMELFEAQWEVRMLKKAWIKRPPGEPPPTNREAVDLLVQWAAVVFKVLMDFGSKKTAAVSDGTGSVN